MGPQHICIKYTKREMRNILDGHLSIRFWRKILYHDQTHASNLAGNPMPVIMDNTYLCYRELSTVEPCPVDTPLLWTPHHCGHFSPSPFDFPYTVHSVASGHRQFHQCGHLAIVDTFCPVVYISEVLLYLSVEGQHQALSYSYYTIKNVTIQVQLPNKIDILAIVSNLLPKSLLFWSHTYKTSAFI